MSTKTDEDTQKQMTKAEVLKRIRGLSATQRASVVCGLVGHSRLRSFCFGYNYCGRCGAQLGDSLGGSFQVSDEVIQHHDGSQEGCNCAENFERITWRDTLLVEGAKDWTAPFAEEPTDDQTE